MKYFDIEQCVGSQKIKRDKQSQSDATDNEKENQNGQGKDLIDDFVGQRLCWNKIVLAGPTHDN